jgi:hypothetical protein
MSNTPGSFIWNILHLLKYKDGSDVTFTVGTFACGSDTIPVGLPLWLEGF